MIRGKPKLSILIIIIIILILILLWFLGYLGGNGGSDTTAGMTVFVSSETFDGNFGSGQVTLGHLDADNQCQVLADRAGLSGTFKAWISGRVDTGAGPLAHGVADRFAHSSDPYRLVNGAQVAANWADLTDGSLDHAINMDENGSAVGESARVWTNTRTNGRAWDNSRNCAVGPGPDTPSAIASWSCGPPGWSPQDCQFQSGKFGLANSTSGSWTGTASSNNSCSSSYHLYCVQQ